MGFDPLGEPPRRRPSVAPGVAALMLGVFFGACAHGPDLRRGPEIPPKPILETLANARARVGSLSGVAKASVRTPRGAATLSLTLEVQRPGRLSMQIVDFFERPQAMLVSDGERFALISVEERRVYRGPASAAVLDRTFGLPLSPADLTTLLLGSAPLLEEVDGARAWEADREGEAYLELMGPDGTRQTLLVEVATGRTLESRVEDPAEGSDGLSVRFEDHQAFGDVRFPRRVALEGPRGEVALELRYGQLSLGTPIDPSIFSTDLAPEGFEEVLHDPR